MKQYCKYCANAYLHGDCHCWCEEKQKLISEASASKVNKCKQFELHEMSVFDPNQIYSPHKEKANDGAQIRMEV